MDVASTTHDSTSTSILSSGTRPADPPWAKIPHPQYPWSLTEIKDGVSVAVHPLGIANVNNNNNTTGCTTVIGRCDETVDIILRHDSVSRIHARIAFDGVRPWLKDWQSAHGVRVNRKSLPRAAIGRHESNSLVPGARGVLLYPGDILQFGASTRIFCLEGPEEFARGVVDIPTNQKVEIMNDKLSQNDSGNEISNTSSKHLSHGDVNSDDECTDEQPERSNARLITDETVPEKFLKDWERLKALRYKLENFNRESERIRVKGELTSGQERQLERNDERVGQLKKTIQDKEDDLYQKVYPQERQRHLTHVHHDSSHRQKRNREGEDVDFEEDYFDRTKTRDDSQNRENDAESEETLLKKWSELQQQQNQLSESLKRRQLEAQSLELKIAVTINSEEDVFFLKNELDLLNDSIGKLQTNNDNIDASVLETTRLLRIVNPKLKLKDGMWSTKSRDTDNSISKASTTITASESTFDGPKNAAAESMLPPRQRIKANPTLTNQPQLSEGPSTIPLSSFPSTRTAATSTLSALSLAMPAPKVISSRTTGTVARDRTSGDGNIKGSMSSTLGVSATSDGAIDVWQAPVDQDGSGITKLNAKFAGRY